MSTNYEINAEVRDIKGTSASKRLRREGRVPAIMYGAGGDNQQLTLDHNEILRNLEHETFHSAIIQVKTPQGKEKAILRDVQMHPYRPQVMHVDLQRVSETEKLHIAIPLHFVGEDVAPGVKLEGGIMSHLINEVDVECLPADLPEYLEVDVSALNMHDTVKLSEIKLPDGVEITALAHGGEDQTVAAVSPPQAAEVEELAEGEEGEVAAAAGEEAPAAEEEKGEDKE